MSKEKEQNDVVRVFGLYMIVYEKICKNLGYPLEIAEEVAFQKLSERYGAQYLNELFLKRNDNG